MSKIRQIVNKIILQEMRSLKEGTEASSIFKKFGIKKNSFIPQNDEQDDKVSEIEDALEDAGFDRRKSTGSEYEYEYIKGSEKVLVNYRFGKGYSAIWIIN